MHKFLRYKITKKDLPIRSPAKRRQTFFSLMKQKGVNKGGQFKLNVSWLYGEKLLLVAFLLWCLLFYSDLLFRRREFR